MKNAKKYAAVICEYNPFHFGHRHQLDKLGSEFDGVVCIMSGNLVQRGSLAVADKYLRAEAALQNGADLVVELPFPWCCSSARDFARAGVHIAECLGVSHLAFGAEDGIETLFKLDELMSDPEFSDKVTNLVASCGNISYPAAVGLLVGEKFGDEYASAVAKPNNILALEYISALKRNGSVEPFAVRREGSLKSSSDIRSLGNGALMLDELPPESRKVFERVLGTDFPREISRLDAYFIGILRSLAYSEKQVKGIYSVPDDLVKKLITESARFSTVDGLVTACADKIYTYARVRRALIAIVFGVTEQHVHSLPPYTCVLASDSIGRDILRNAKSNSRIDIITKPVKALSCREETKQAFIFSKRADDILSLSSPVPIPADRGRTPLIV